MNQQHSVDIAIIGGGIIGLSHAYMAARKGYKVAIFERNEKAVGASIRNFGLIWPIGQNLETLDRAMRSRNHWLEVGKAAGLSVRENGSLHLAYHLDELDVLEDFMETSTAYGCSLIAAKEAANKNRLIKKEGLMGALWSETELTVDPRESIEKIPLWLEKKFGVTLKFGNAVKEISYPKLTTASGEIWAANQIFVCGGADFETLYPEIFKVSGMTKCKLQMMRVKYPLNVEEFGPSLCAGLTLGHYASFSRLESLKKLTDRFNKENPEYSENGIHVLLSQNGSGDLIIGDSHHYGLNPEPFDNETIDNLILKYLSSFTDIKPLTIKERWHGIYPKISGKTEFMMEPEKGVKIVTGLGGAGMTLSFGLAEENIASL